LANPRFGEYNAAERISDSTHFQKAPQSENARVLYCDFKNDNFVFEKTTDMINYYHPWNNDLNALQKYAQHITIRESTGLAQSHGVASYLSLFQSLETITIQEPENCLC
jgi:hypothetical protein